MDQKDFVRRLAGLVITTGFVLGWYFDELFYFITLFAGLNLLQSSFTGFCPPEIFYERYMAE